MSALAKFYIAVIITGGAAAIARGVFLWHPHDLVRLLCYLALAIPASCLKVRLPGVSGTISVLFIFLLASVAELGVSEAILIGTICVFFQSCWHAKFRPRVVQIAFSMAAVALAVTAAELAWRLPLEWMLPLQTPFRLCA